MLPRVSLFAEALTNTERAHAAVEQAVKLFLDVRLAGARREIEAGIRRRAARARRNEGSPYASTALPTGESGPLTEETARP